MTAEAVGMGRERRIDWWTVTVERSLGIAII